MRLYAVQPGFDSSTLSLAPHAQSVTQHVKLAPERTHGSGVNVLMADGQVRVVKRGVAIAVWRSLGSRNGGEIPTSF